MVFSVERLVTRFPSGAARTEAGSSFLSSTVSVSGVSLSRLEADGPLPAGEGSSAHDQIKEDGQRAARERARNLVLALSIRDSP